MSDLPHPPRSSAAAERNQGHILAQLQRLLPPSGRLLELASGTGQHAAHCAAGLPGWVWQASDPDGDALPSIAAWAWVSPAAARLPQALLLDVLDWPWPDAAASAGPWDAMFCANLLHIAPWACCGALMRGAAALLSPGGLLVTYGPYRVQGEPLADSNAEFDASLRQRDDRWGLRWLHEVAAEAEAAGLALSERVAMPANNQLLVFRLAATA